jgi:hypothetical protein
VETAVTYSCTHSDVITFSLAAGVPFVLQSVDFVGFTADDVATVTLHLFATGMKRSADTRVLNATSATWTAPSVLPLATSIDVTPSAANQSFGIASINVVSMPGLSVQCVRCARV